MSVASHQRRLSVHAIRQKKQQHEKIVVLTAYDYSTAKVMDATEQVDIILVGDSLGMVVLGYPDTLSVTMEDMLHHVKAVSRATQHALLVADMPFMSVHVDLSSAVTNAARMIQEGRADAVKLEGASPLTLQIVSHLTQIGIPVMGHLGFTPQFINTLGGFKVQGKSTDALSQLLQDALALQATGAFALVLEMVPQEVAALLTGQLDIPTIGIGAGPNCDGQVLVVDDMLGRFPNFTPKFVRRYAEMGKDLEHAVKAYAEDIVTGMFPHPQTESFHASSDLLKAIEQLRLQQNAVEAPHALA